MRKSAGWLAFLALLAAGVAAALRGGPGMIAAIAAFGIVAHAAMGVRARTALFSVGPVLIFAAMLMALQWMNGAVDIRLPLRSVSVFLCSTAAFRALPLPALIAGLDARSCWYVPVMFLLFVRHFAAVLTGEIRRAYHARSLCVTANYRRGGFQSLAWVTVSVFRRVIDRAERFYAAQVLQGAQQ